MQRLTSDTLAGRLRAFATERSFTWPAAYRPLIVVMLVGVAARVIPMVIYAPTAYNWVDSVRLTRADSTGLFSDFWMPAGYAAFSETLRAITNSLPVTIGVQHVLGLVTALLLYATTRRALVPRWVALLPAAAIAVSGDHIYLEHSLMTETLSIVLLAAGLYAGVRSLNTNRSYTWLGAASALLALSGLVRTPGLALVPVLAIWAGVAWRRPRAELLRRVAVALLPGVLLVGAYAGVAQAVGPYTGLYEMSGLHLYGRVADFADCRDFTPPSGTRALCPSTSPAQRPGPFGYVWVPTSPARQRWGLTPHAASEAGRFARATILHQPIAYTKAVVKDTLRYIEPTIGTDRPLSGTSPQMMSFGQHDPGTTAFVLPWIARAYDSTHPNFEHGIQLLDGYEKVFRIGGIVLVALWVLTLAGMLFGRGRARSGAWLLGGAAFVLYVGPVMTISYDARYGIPAETALIGAAAMAGWALSLRRAGVDARDA